MAMEITQFSKAASLEKNQQKSENQLVIDIMVLKELTKLSLY